MVEPKIKRKIADMLKEDLGLGDVTSRALVDARAVCRGRVVVRDGGVLAGLEEATEVFRLVRARVFPWKRDGDRVGPGETVAVVDGPARGILAVERTALNLLMRMSGIATATRVLVDISKKKSKKVKIAATRKTAPLLTYFDKRAVILGGGVPHRWTLSDHVLIKDSHLKFAGSISDAIAKSRAMYPSLKVEIEVSRIREAVEAARAGADIIMFDNMRPVEIKKAVARLEQEGLRSRVVLEASGGVNPSNVANFASTGVDIISSGYITMRAPALDMCLELENP